MEIFAHILYHLKMNFMAHFQMLNDELILFLFNTYTFMIRSKHPCIEQNVCPSETSNTLLAYIMSTFSKV